MESETQMQAFKKVLQASKRTKENGKFVKAKAGACLRPPATRW